MARLVLAVIFAAIVLGAVAIAVRSLRTAIVQADRGRGFDMAETGMLAKVAYVLLLVLILYVTLTAAGG